MKIFAVVLMLVVLASAKENPAEFNLTAHVISAQLNRSSGSVYNPGQNGTVGQYSYGTTSSWVTEVQIGSLIYSAHRVCKAAQVGSDYPAKMEKNRLELLVGDKVCKYRVTGTREATSK